METYYSDHWKTIEPERLARYEEFFQFRPEQEPFLAALNLEGARRVLDFGCGPGFMAAEIARRISGEVVGADLNRDFIDRAAERESADNLQFVHLAGEGDQANLGRFDRLVCKNVLEYVPDAAASVAGFYDLLEPGGEILLIDSDWGFVLVEPWGKQRTDDFFAAAAGAFNERFIGRKLSGLLSKAGFTDVQVKILAGADLKGRGIGVLMNMVSYIKSLSTMDLNEAQAMLKEVEMAVDTGEFLFVLPEFLVSTRKGSEASEPESGASP